MISYVFPHVLLKKIFIVPAEQREKMIEIPKDILWDYKEAPPDLLWRLQRIADFFPYYGRDKETVMALYENIDKLKIDRTTKLLIAEYKRAWEEKSGGNKK